MQKEIYRHKDFEIYKDKIGEKYTPLEFKGEYGLTIQSFKIQTLVNSIIWKATLSNEIVTQIFLTPLEKIDDKTQRYRLEWGIVKK